MTSMIGINYHLMLSLIACLTIYMITSWSSSFILYINQTINQSKVIET